MKKITLLTLFYLLIGCSLNAQIVITDADLLENTDYLWTNDQEYILDGLVIVKPGSELTVEAGTVIKGKEIPTNPNDFTSWLVVAKGASIVAIGEPTCPIIFTAEIDDVSNPLDLGSDDRGLWGGIVFCGNGDVARPGNSDLIEGAPQTNPYLQYGGGINSDNTDYSGTLRFISIRHAGGLVSPGNHISPLTFAGVGNSTTVEFVEAYASGDDGFEFLGGAVNTKYLISAYCNDDAFDIDYGYQGKGQFWFGVQAQGYDNGFEIDGAKPDDQANYSNPILSNITMIGDGDFTVNNGLGNCILMRDNTAGSIYNSIFQTQTEIAISIENLDFGADSYLNFQNGEINFANNLWFNFATGNNPNDFLTIGGIGGATELVTLVDYFNNNNNDITNPQLSSICFGNPTCLDPLPATGSPALTGALALNDPFFTNTTYRGAFGTNNWTNQWSILDPNHQLGSCLGVGGIVEGKITVQKDENNNCSPDVGELGLNDWIIQINSPNFNYFVKTNSNGEYNGYIPTSATEAVLQPINNLWGVCQTTIPLVDLGVPGATNAAFSVAAIADCPLMSVDLSTPFLRRCFPNVYNVSYCNNGTTIANDARVEVELDSFLMVNSTSIPFTINGDGKYVFDLGDVAINECGNIFINATVSCDADLGITHCSSAEIFPDTICNPSVSAPLIKVESECVGGDVIFTLENIGDIGMTDAATYIVTEDHVMHMQSQTNPTFLLDVGQTKTVTIPATGSTFHLQTIKRPGYPEFGVITDGIEACGTNSNGTFSVGFLNGFSLASSSQNIAIDCQENIGSYDPNDKTAYPTGIQTERYLRANTDVEYRIRFQNTGTDTAFTVVIVDTLSEFFNLNTIRIGAASHDFEWSLDSNTLTFTFDNIMLPDSNINEPASHGFVKFKISQQPDLPDGILLTNFADIYFDFNEAIRTNEEFYTIGQPLDDVLNVFNFYPTTRLIKVFPNPFKTRTTFDLEEVTVKNGNLKIFDTMGRLIHYQNFEGNRIEYMKGNIQEGMYFFKIEGDGQVIGVGKLIVR